jgi:hypothetical protein
MRRSTPGLAAACVAGVIALSAIALAAGQTRAGQTPARDTSAPTTPAQAATGSIAGALISLDTGRPIRRGEVTISGGDGAHAKTVTTDDQGAFSFTGLPAGAYFLSARKSGYLDVTYGQKRPGSGASGTAIPLADSQHLGNLKFALPRGGVITGLVTDEAGEPAYNVPVRVMRYVLRSGERTLASAGSTSTDDRGIYRVPLLPPGEYVVSAAPSNSVEQEMVATMKARLETIVSDLRNGSADPAAAAQAKMAMAAAQPPDTSGPASGYAPVYYPGTTAISQAVSVVVEVGQERAGVDLQLQLVPMTRVTGTVQGQDASLKAAVILTLVDTSAPALTSTSRTARSDNEGRFTFTGVPPGQYTLFARTQQVFSVQTMEPAFGGETQKPLTIVTTSTNSGPALWGSTEVSVDGAAPIDVPISLQRAMTVTGELKFDAASSDVDFTRARVTLQPWSTLGGDVASTATGTVDANGRFTVNGVLPGKYRVSVGGLPSRWQPRTAVFGGRDILDFALDVKAGEDQAGGVVTFTTRLADLSGMLQDSAGHPTADYTIVLFPSDARYWTPNARRIQATRPSTDGVFHFRNLPAGDYKLIAVTDVEQGQWFDPAFLQQLAAPALTLSFGEGERKVQDLRVR